MIDDSVLQESVFDNFIFVLEIIYDKGVQKLQNLDVHFECGSVCLIKYNIPESVNTRIAYKNKVLNLHDKR